MADVHDHIQQRAYWQDNTAQATFDQAQQQTFTPYEGVLGRGYTQAAIWVRLQIVPTAHSAADDKLVLRIRPVFLDRIALFDPLDTSGKRRIAGDQTEYNQQEYKSLAHTFVIPMGQQPRYVWLRLEATSTTLMHVQALSLDDMQQDENRFLLINFFTLSLIVVFVLLAMINWFNHREFLYGAFVVRNLTFLLYAAAFFGLHRFLLADSVSAQHIDTGYNWLIVCATAFTFWFEIQFLSEYKPPLWVRCIFYGLLLWSAVIFALLFLGQTHLSLKLNMILNGMGVCLMFVLSATFIDDKRTNTSKTASLLKKKTIVGYYGVLASLLLFAVLPYLGQIAGSEFAANGLVVYAVISGLQMTILMQMRTQQLQKASIQMANDLARSAQQVLIEKNRHEESAQLLTMLMHELKNPLAVIDLAHQASDDAAAKEYVSRNVAIIRNVLDQCLNTDRLSDGKISIIKSPIDLVELIDDLIEPHHPHPFKLSFPPNIQSVHAFQTDYQCVRTVLANLIDNAMRYGDTSQAIGIAITPERNAAGAEGMAIEVTNKPGLASWPDANKVFQKYYRSIGAKTISGTGLGLFLVRSLCNLLGGNCTYEPDDTHVKFKVWLPI